MLRQFFVKYGIYEFGFTRPRLTTQNVMRARKISTMNSKTSNIIATDIPKYKDKDPPIAPVRVVSC